MAVTPALAATTALYCTLLSAPAVAELRSAALRAHGTEWVLHSGTASSMKSSDLVGAQLILEGGAVIRIDAAHPVSDGQGHQWWAHQLSVQGSARDWQPLCAPHSDGTSYAIVLPGRQEADGTLSEDAAEFTISCTSGALAKCLRMGYEPWRVRPDGSSLRATFNACVRMIRADYAGTGVPFTENGRTVDAYDRDEVQTAERSAEQQFEAGWDDRGAVCVHHVRVAEKVSLVTLQTLAPRLKGNVGAICTEAYARALGALVFNRSSAPLEGGSLRQNPTGGPTVH